MIIARIFFTTALISTVAAIPRAGEAQPWGSLSPNNLRGVVLSFDRNKCPKGWEEYTALRGRGVIGVNPPVSGGAPANALPRYDLAMDYGASSVTLSVGQLPPHTHPYNDIYYSEASGPTEGGAVPVPGNYGSKSTDTDNHGLQIARTTGPTGAGQPVPIQPPVRALLFCKLL
jgi:hypothetical protein